MSSLIRIGVVDDHPLFREGLARTLSRYDGLEIVATGGTAEDTVRMAAEQQPDVIVMDMNMPGGGITAIEGIVAAGYPSKVLVLSMRDDIETVRNALHQGAFGYILKGSASGEVAKAIQALHQGDRYITPSLAVGLLTQASPRTQDHVPQRDPLESLTERESEVLSIMVEGNSNKEIGNKLTLSEKTIKHHVTRILQKLSVRNRVEAVLLASKRKRTGGAHLN